MYQKRGNRANMPLLHPGEIYLAQDTRQLFICIKDGDFLVLKECPYRRLKIRLRQWILSVRRRLLLFAQGH